MKEIPMQKNISQSFLNMFQVPAKMALKYTLSKMMMELGYSEIRKFKWLLQFTCFQRSLPEIPVNVLWPITRTGGAVDQEEEGLSGLVDQMVQRLGRESMDVAREVLMDMNRIDVVRKLPGIRFGTKGWTNAYTMYSYDLIKKVPILIFFYLIPPEELQSLLFQKVSMTTSNDLYFLSYMVRL